MEMTQELSEKIEAYIDGTLGGKTLVEFEDMMANNPELKDKVALQRELKNRLKNQKTIDFRKKLIQINEEIKNDTSTQKTEVRPTISLYWKAAASILVLIGISALFWFNNSTQEDLFAMYYTPYPIGDIKRSSETSSDTDFKKIVLQYKRKEYAKVIPDLEHLVEQNPNNEPLKLCLGNSYLNVDSLTKAEALFQDFSSESRYYNDARWFLSLTYLKMKKEKPAINMLKQLTVYENIHKQNAQQLLQKLTQ